MDIVLGIALGVAVLCILFYVRNLRRPKPRYKIHVGTSRYNIKHVIDSGAETMDEALEKARNMSHTGSIRPVAVTKAEYGDKDY